jgi:hypothetical protein
MSPKIVKTDPATIPPGEYKAMWCAYRITADKPHSFTLWTENGIRGWAPVIVKVAADGTITVS